MPLALHIHKPNLFFFFQCALVKNSGGEAMKTLPTYWLPQEMNVVLV